MEFLIIYFDSSFHVLMRTCFHLNLFIQINYNFCHQIWEGQFHFTEKCHLLAWFWKQIDVFEVLYTLKHMTMIHIQKPHEGTLLLRPIVEGYNGYFKHRIIYTIFYLICNHYIGTLHMMFIIHWSISSNKSSNNAHRNFMSYKTFMK